MIPVQTEKNQFNLIIQQRPSVLDNITFKENINVKYFNLLMKHKDKYLHTLKTHDWDESKLLSKYNKLLKSNKHQYAEVNWARRKIKYGRVFAKRNVSVMCFRDIIRNTLCFENYHDIDIDNCFPNILNQICIVNGLACKELSYYCENRNDILEELTKTFGIERYPAKLLFIMLLFGGSIGKWRTDNKIEGNLSKFVYRFEAEIKKISKNIYECNVDLQKHINETRMKDDPFYDKERTWEGNILSTFLGHYEEMILECIYNFLTSNRYITDSKCVLAFDGIMIRKHKSIDNVKQLLRDICSYVYKELGFVIKMSEKSMKVNLIQELEDLITLEQNSVDNNQLNIKEKVDKIITEFVEDNPYDDITSFNQNLWNYIETKYRILDMTKDYYLKREYFSRFYICLSENNTFLVRKPNVVNGSIEYHRNTHLNFNHLKYQETMVLENGDEKIVDYPYSIMVNKEDKTYPRFTHECFNPIGINQKEMKRNYFNRFFGFGYKDINKNDIYNEESMKLLKWYLSYILDYICGGDNKVFVYYLSHLKFILTNPTEKNGIGVAFYSKDKGSGKNKHADFIKKVIGEYLCVSTKIGALFERFSDLDDYLCVFFDEVSSNDLSNNTHYSTLKTKITEISTRRDIKNQDPTKSNSFSRFFFLTNELNAFRVDSDERRMFFLGFHKEQDKEKVKTIYQKLLEVDNNPVIHKLFGKFLETSSLLKSYGNPTQWAEKKPITEVSKLFQYTNAVETFMCNVLMNTLNVGETIDSRSRAETVEKFIIRMEDNNYIFNTNHLYCLFLEIYNNDNNKKSASFKKDTFKKNLRGIYNKMKSSRDREAGCEVLIVDKDYLINRLKDLKILESKEDNSIFHNHLKNKHTSILGSVNKKSNTLRNSIKRKHSKKISKDIEENNEFSKEFTKDLTNSFEKLETHFKILN